MVDAAKKLILDKEEEREEQEEEERAPAGKRMVWLNHQLQFFKLPVSPECQSISRDYEHRCL